MSDRKLKVLQSVAYQSHAEFTVSVPFAPGHHGALSMVGLSFSVEVTCGNCGLVRPSLDSGLRHAIICHKDSAQDPAEPAQKLKKKEDRCPRCRKCFATAFEFGRHEKHCSDVNIVTGMTRNLRRGPLQSTRFLPRMSPPKPCSPTKGNSVTSVCMPTRDEGEVSLSMGTVSHEDGTPKHIVEEYGEEKDEGEVSRSMDAVSHEEGTLTHSMEENGERKGKADSSRCEYVMLTMYKMKESDECAWECPICYSATSSREACVSHLRICIDKNPGKLQQQNNVLLRQNRPAREPGTASFRKPPWDVRRVICLKVDLLPDLVNTAEGTDCQRKTRKRRDRRHKPRGRAVVVRHAEVVPEGNVSEVIQTPPEPQISSQVGVHVVTIKEELVIDDDCDFGIMAVSENERVKPTGDESPDASRIQNFCENMVLKNSVLVASGRKETPQFSSPWPIPNGVSPDQLLVETITGVRPASGGAVQAQATPTTGNFENTISEHVFEDKLEVKTEEEDGVILYVSEVLEHSEPHF